ncbi:hypothetical protein [Tianweitania sediminis]|uniref:Transmembrane protein n=1 Tax=Tianweitania sediminis TaxID=1502156 RepID=A0A8J7ULE5_9HYPH|nr:hypothetical protein [Tianweitania sediminis]MBP0440654.1 hypothetical protein [Tianweitania sediminis]
MMDIWREFNTLLGPLIAMAAGGIVWFAYYHPDSYYRVSLWVYFALLAIYLVLLGGEIGYSLGAEAVLEHIAAGGQAESFDKTPFGANLLWFLLVWAVMIALRFIHRLRDDKPDDRT